VDKILTLAKLVDSLYTLNGGAFFIMGKNVKTAYC